MGTHCMFPGQLNFIKKEKETQENNLQIITVRMSLPQLFAAGLLKEPPTLSILGLFCLFFFFCEDIRKILHKKTSHHFPQNAKNPSKCVVKSLTVNVILVF